MQHARKDYQHIQDSKKRIPDHEPVFLLRAQDRCAVAALQAWIKAAKENNVDPVMIQAAEGQLSLFNLWQSQIFSKKPDL